MISLRINIKITARLLAFLLMGVVFFASSNTAVFAALSSDQKDMYQKWINYFDVATGCSTSAAPDVSNNDNTGQIKIFASALITSTWNIPDSTVEQWFLKQAGAQATIGKYGLSSSNIGNITAAIKEAGVSPVFFYSYTVSEGGGAGGFINHFGGDTGGGGAGNAKRDAEYLAAQSKVMDSKPSWIDAGNPVDFVPQNIKSSGDADFKNMPARTIGRAYIPATAATTWEVYYPDGLKKEFNKVQDYGRPLEATMQNIRAMGGDPLQGGASISSTDCTTNGVTGEGIQKAINFAVAIAQNDGYGYDQPTRESGWQKWQADSSCTSQCGSFDCSSLIAAALTEAGYFNTNPNFATGTEGSELARAGFKKVNVSTQTSTDLQPGDILISSSHTEMYIGDGKSVGAHINENGRVSGGKVGDQNGKEISVTPYYDDNWTDVYRAPS